MVRDSPRGSRLKTFSQRMLRAAPSRIDDRLMHFPFFRFDELRVAEMLQVNSDCCLCATFRIATMLCRFPFAWQIPLPSRSIGCQKKKFGLFVLLYRSHVGQDRSLAPTLQVARSGALLTRSMGAEPLQQMHR